MPMLNNSVRCRPRNIIAQSQSGTGKTAAFVLTMLSRLEPSHNLPQVRGAAYKYSDLNNSILVVQLYELTILNTILY